MVKMEKWLYANKINDDQKLSISGHFSSQEYKNLFYQLEKKLD